MLNQDSHHIPQVRRSGSFSSETLDEKVPGAEEHESNLPTSDRKQHDKSDESKLIEVDESLDSSHRWKQQPMRLMDFVSKEYTSDLTQEQLKTLPQIQEDTKIAGLNKDIIDKYYDELETPHRQ